MTTFTAKSETVQRDWYLVDAAGKTLGRLSTNWPAACAASTSRFTPLTSILAITSW